MQTDAPRRTMDALPPAPCCSRKVCFNSCSRLPLEKWAVGRKTLKMATLLQTSKATPGLPLQSRKSRVIPIPASFKSPPKTRADEALDHLKKAQQAAVRFRSLVRKGTLGLASVLFVVGCLMLLLLTLAGFNVGYVWPMCMLIVALPCALLAVTPADEELIRGLCAASLACSVVACAVALCFASGLFKGGPRLALSCTCAAISAIFAGAVLRTLVSARHRRNE